MIKYYIHVGTYRLNENLKKNIVLGYGRASESGLDLLVAPSNFWLHGSMALHTALYSCIAYTDGGTVNDLSSVIYGQLGPVYWLMAKKGPPKEV